ncbi:MAG: hypothetical protein ACP5G7_10320 [Anaerolineae bacterium]
MKLARSVACAIVLLAVAFAHPVVAESKQAGLIVVFAADDIHEACIALDDGPASGMSLLSRAGLGVISVSDPDDGTLVCRIAEVGCSFPEEDCLCQCGGPCVAWHYWVWQDGGWELFEGSPTERSVERGDVDAWVWGTADALPPELSGEGPCGPLLAMPQAVGDDDAYPEPPDLTPPPEEPYPGATDEPGDGSTPEPQATSTLKTTATRTGVASPSATDTLAFTGTPGRTSSPATVTPTLERVELPTETSLPPTSTPAEDTPDAGATLVVRAATRGAAWPTQEPRPDPDARVPAGRLGAAAFALLAVVLGAAWWRWRQSRSGGPPAP